MAIIKCKMCGGNLEVVAESRVAVCEYCGTQQTVPSADNEKKLTLFGRANRLRMACEFDKAAGVYESIVADFPEEAEAYWGLVLCKYGIEYVDDPATGKKIPTCHRSSFDSVMDDSNLEQALENADAIARRVYRDEAKAIEDLRKGIIEVSGKEDPYDIFICYKETDDNGDRTIDSVIAQEVYDALTEKGYRVFFSRITLEDKLGQEYEPYIFAALHSAKIMLAFGTDYEYYNAVWVKNEWSRFLQLIAAGEKKTLIPCYKNIDAYDMPKEFARLQAQDMGKVGAMQDLLRGIEKILPREKQVVKETVVVQQSGGNNKVQALLDRGNMALEDGEWAKADGFFEEVLNNDAKCAWAYVGKTLAQERCKSLDAFVEKRIAIGSEVKAEKATIPSDEAHIQEMVAKYVLKNYLNLGEIRELYQYDLSYAVTASSCEEDYKQAEAYWNNHKLLTRAESFAVGEAAEKLHAAKERLFSTLRENLQRAKEEDESAKQALQERYRVFLADADEKAAQLRVNAETARENDYQRWAECAKNGAETVLLARAVQELSKLDGYKESNDLIALCNKRIEEIRAVKAAEAEAKRQAEAAEAARLAAIKAEEDRLRASEAAKRAAEAKKITAIVASAIIVAIAVVLVVTKVVIPNGKYNEGVALMEDGQYEQAVAVFESLAEYKDSAEKKKESLYLQALSYQKSEQFERAIDTLKKIKGYKDVEGKITECEEAILENKYIEACTLMSNEEYEKAITAFEIIKDYKESKEKLADCAIVLAQNCVANGDTKNAIKWFSKGGDSESANKERYNYVQANKNNTDTTTFEYLKTLRAANYKDSSNIYASLYKVTGKVFFNESLDDTSTSKTTIHSADSSGYNDAYCHYQVTGGTPGSEIKVKIVYETRWGTDNNPREPYKVDTTKEFTVKPGEDNIFIYMRLASNIYYHRVTLYNAETGEQLAQETLYSLHLR